MHPALDPESYPLLKKYAVPLTTRPEDPPYGPLVLNEDWDAARERIPDLQAYLGTLMLRFSSPLHGLYAHDVEGLLRSFRHSPYYVTPQASPDHAV